MDLPILEDRTFIKLYPDIIDICDGNFNAAIFLQCLIYWWDKKDERADIYKTEKNIQEETRLTRPKQDAAIKILVEKGFVTKVLRSIPRKRHFILNVEMVEEAISNIINPMSEKNTTVCRKETSCSVESQQAITKNKNNNKKEIKKLHTPSKNEGDSSVDEESIKNKIIKILFESSSKKDLSKKLSEIKIGNPKNTYKQKLCYAFDNKKVFDIIWDYTIKLKKLKKKDRQIKLDKTNLNRLHILCTQREMTYDTICKNVKRPRDFEGIIEEHFDPHHDFDLNSGDEE